MARPAKYSDEQLIKITQDFLNEGELGCPTYQKLSNWAKQQGYDIGEQAFRSRQSVVELLKRAKEQYRTPVVKSEEGAYLSFDVQSEMMKIRSTKKMQELIDTLVERETYFKSLYERNCDLHDKMIKQNEQLVQAMDKIQELEQNIAQMQQKNVAYKHENVTLKQKNSRMKAVLEEQIYPEIALSELDELGLRVERSKMPESIREHMVADGNGQSHTELTDKVVPFLRTQVERAGPEVLVVDKAEVPHEESESPVEEFQESDAGMDLMVQMLRKFQENR